MRPKKLVLGIVALVTAVSTAFALNLPAPFFTLQVLAKTANERKAVAERLFRQARQEFNNNKFEAALQFWQQALHIYREIKDRLSEGAALGGIGLAYHSLGDFNKAIEYQQQYLTIAREFKDRESEETALGNLGLTYHSLGEYFKAIDYQQQSLSIARKRKDRDSEGKALGHLGIVYISLGDYSKAIEYQQQWLAIAREIKDREGEGKALGNLGLAYLYLGNYPKAIKYVKQVLSIAREFKDRQSEGTALGILGSICQSLGIYPEAIKYHQQRWSIAREIKDRQSEGAALGNIGLAYYSLREYPQAIDYLEQALSIAKEVTDREGKGIALSNLGLTYLAQGNHVKAIEYQQQSLALAQEIKDRLGEGVALNNLGLTFLESGNLTESERKLYTGIQVWESQRDLLGNNDTNQVSIFEEQSRTYFLLQKVFIAQNKTDAALEIAEFSRTRAFVKLLQQRLFSRNTKQPFVNAPNILQIKQIAKEQKATLVEYSIINNNYTTKESDLYIWVIRPTGEVNFRQVDLKPLLQKQNISLKDLVRNNLESLGVAKGTTRSVRDKQTFAVGDFIRLNNDFSTDPAWEVVAVNLQNSTLKLRNTTWDKGTQTITRPFTDATKVSSPFSANIHSQQLHQLLIDPIADLLPKDKGDRIIFIPQGSLFFVPFPALQDADRKYLIQKHTILTAPSIQVLSLTRQKRQQISGTSKDVLVVGNPTMPKVSSYPGEPAQQLKPLPNSELEAKDVARMYKTNAIVGNKATKSAILPLLPKARIIHLATHGLLNDFTGGGIPGAVALAPEPLNQGKDERANGLLTASEIFDLKLNNTELVVLSACNTGVGRITGDGVIGLSRSLISAGVPSVIVSLWSIPDAPTASLMTEFYQRLQQGNDKASALRQAMLKTMEKHPDPKNWAAFTLIGESD